MPITNAVAVLVLITSNVTTNWTIRAPASYIDWTGTNRYQMQTGVLVTNVVAGLPWHGHTIDVILEENEGPVIKSKRLVPMPGNTNEVQIVSWINEIDNTSMPPTPKAPPPLPLGIRSKQ